MCNVNSNEKNAIRRIVYRCNFSKQINNDES